MWGKWLAGAVFAGATVLCGCDSADDDFRRVGQTQETMPGAEPEVVEPQAPEAQSPEYERLPDGAMIKGGGQMVRPGEE